MSRDRAQGWQHAKLTGHQNETSIEKLVNENINSFNIRLNKANLSGNAIVGGIYEKSLVSILEDKTKSKTDLFIKWEDETQSNISIKKSLGGQVYLIGTSRFIKGFELLFNQEIPTNVKEALFLFFGESNKIPEILNREDIKKSTDSKIYAYQQRKHRLVWKTLEIYDNNLATALIKWFQENIDKITIFCFSSGLVKNRSDWAEFIWYRNLIGENDIDLLIPINDLIEKIKNKTHLIMEGTVNGGTTIKLPFGFVQWHQGQMQFHHNYDLIKEVINS